MPRVVARCCQATLVARTQAPGTCQQELSERHGAGGEGAQTTTQGEVMGMRTSRRKTWVGVTAVFLNNNLLTFGCAGSSLLCGLFSSCGEKGLLLSLRWLLMLQRRALGHRLNSCGPWA